MKELGDIIGVDSGQISNLENEKRTPSVKNLHKLSKALSYNLVDLTLNEENVNAVKKRLGLLYH